MYNVVLLAMSTLNDRGVEEHKYGYKYVEGSEEKEKIILGRSQLEPITHMLDIKLAMEGESLDKAIILTTKETKNDQNVTIRYRRNRKKKKESRTLSTWMRRVCGDRKQTPEEVIVKKTISAVNYYKERVRRFNKNVIFEEVDIDEKEPAQGIADAISKIIEENNKHEEMRLWIDTQGGFRDISMVINAIISLLKEQGIKPAGIYAIRFNPGAQDMSKKGGKITSNQIIDQTEKYRIFDFVSAMQEFMDYGKAGGLQKYLGGENEFAKIAAGIADAIQMCQPKGFEKGLKKLAEYLDSGQYQGNDTYMDIFADYIRKDYGILLDEPENPIEQIKWCVKKEFYQQAITIYIEQMPKYYYDKGWLGSGIALGNKRVFGEDPYVKYFYTDLFNGLVEKDEKDEKDEELAKILKDAVSRGKVYDRRGAVVYLNEKRKNATSDKVDKAIRRIVGQIGERFDENGKIKKERDETNGAKCIKTYLNSMSVESGKKDRYRMLYGKDMDTTESTLAKKVAAIKMAEEKTPHLVKIMKYYLAVKLLRNRMNHASEDEAQEDEQNALIFLRNEGIDNGVSIENGEVTIDYQKIGSLLLEGVQAEALSVQQIPRAGSGLDLLINAIERKYFL